MNKHTITDPMPRPDTHKRVRTHTAGGYTIRTMTNEEAAEAVRNGSHIEGEQNGDARILMREVKSV